jgi:hypothetical protein
VAAADFSWDRAAAMPCLASALIAAVSLAGLMMGGAGDCAAAALALTDRATRTPNNLAVLTRLVSQIRL